MSDDLPIGWAIAKVHTVFRSFSGGTPSRTKPSYWGGEILWLSSGDIKSDRIDVSSETITSAGAQNSSARLCRPGSVLVVVRSGILRHTLPIAILNRAATINQDIKCFDSGDDDLNEWLALSLRASTRTILAMNREGTTVQSVKYDTLKSFTLRVPPRAEQRRIIERLETLQALLKDAQSCLHRAASILQTPDIGRFATPNVRPDKLTQSILAKALSGELVPTEAKLAEQEGRSYESASELLARIAMEHTREDKAPSGRVRKRTPRKKAALSRAR